MSRSTSSTAPAAIWAVRPGVERSGGRGHDQAAVLQIWLWDTNDQDTKVKVLMSEGVYRDTAIRNQLKGEHEALSIRPGAEFELSSYKLVCGVRVEKLEYVNQEPATW